MTEPVPESYLPQVEREPRNPEREATRANNLLGLALFGVFLLLFAGTIAVGLVYLAFD